MHGHKSLSAQVQTSKLIIRQEIHPTGSIPGIYRLSHCHIFFWVVIYHSMGSLVFLNMVKKKKQQQITFSCDTSHFGRHSSQVSIIKWVSPRIPQYSLFMTTHGSNQYFPRQHSSCLSVKLLTDTWQNVEISWNTENIQEVPYRYFIA